MKHNQQMIDAYVRIRATGASHQSIAQYLGISKTTSCKWSHLHAEAIQQTTEENREEARFHKHFQRARELVHFNKIIENFLFRIENDRYGFGHTLSYKDTCRMLGLMVKSRESLLQKDGDNPIAVRSLAGHPANPSTFGAKAAPQPTPSRTDTTGMPMPVPQNQQNTENPNKTEPTVEKQPETVPQKNPHSIPVPKEKGSTEIGARPSRPQHSDPEDNVELSKTCRTTMAPPLPDLLGASRPCRSPQHPNPAERIDQNQTTATDPAPSLNRLQIREHRTALLNALEQEVAQIKTRLPQFRNKACPAIQT